MTEAFDFGGDVVWRPTSEYVDRSNLKAFMRLHGIGSYADLMQRSTRDVAWFTEAMLEFLDIRFQQPYSEILDVSAGIQQPVWCRDGLLNITASCLDKWMGNATTADRPAVVGELEDGTVQTLTYAELFGQVNRCANALRSLGFGRGDPIGLYMPMTVEIVVALLAIARIGGVILPLFSGYGAGAVASRLADAGAVGLITADGLHRRGVAIPLKPIVDQALASVPTHRHTLVVRITGQPVTMAEGQDIWWHDLVPEQSDEADFEPTAAEDLFMIIYTSGTTGRPKGAVHTHCSFSVKSAQDMCFGTDVHAGDMVYWMTDMGWMMGPWLVVGSCLLGATFLVYEGAPDYPGPDRLWNLVERHRLEVVGVSPTLIRTLIGHGDEPVKAHDLSSVRLFASTGEPWNPAPWRWLFEVAGKSRRPIINYSGGTEISGGIVMGNTITPLKPAAFSGPCPGMAADVVDENGKSLRGGVGELVIRAPWIGMTRGFWQDDERYLETYWSRWQDVWVHGDWAAIDDDGQWYILGRSDDTINVAGKRVGPAEFESVLVSHPAVSEAGAVGVPHPVKGAEVVCFCVLISGSEASGKLARELVETVATEMGRPLKPAAILFVGGLPMTRSGKVMRRLIRSAYLGEDLGDTSSLVNPEAVEEIGRLGG